MLDTYRARRALPLIVVSFNIALGACRSNDEPAHRPPPVTSQDIVIGDDPAKLAYITVEPVAELHERTVAVIPAQLALDEDHTVRVTSPVAGRAQSVEAEYGAMVQRGQVLARIASGDVAQAQSDVVKAQATVTQTRAALARVRDLYEHHVVAAKDLEQATNDAAQADAELARAAARSRSLGEQSADVGGVYLLRAPVSGVIVDRALSAGTEVRPDAAAPLFLISNLDTLWLTANVFQRDLPNVRPGARLDFTTDAVPNRHFTATITFVSRALDPATRSATLRAVIVNQGGLLRAQTSGTARLIAPSATSQLAVPDGALVTQGAETVVFVERQRGRYERRVVTVGDDDGTAATITSGLKAGDRVVTAGSLLVAAEADRLR